MHVLTDRQIVELAIPAYLLYTLVRAPDVFVPADPARAMKDEAELATLRSTLHAACLEPFAQLAPAKRQALIRRLERVTRRVTADWDDWPALGLAMMLWCFLKDLTDREVLVLWEGSTMDLVTCRLLPKFEHGFGEQADLVAQEHASTLLGRLQAEGLYR